MNLRGSPGALPTSVRSCSELVGVVPFGVAPFLGSFLALKMVMLAYLGSMLVDLGSMLAILTPSWPNLVPTWPHLASTCPDLARF